MGAEENREGIGPCSYVSLSFIFNGSRSSFRSLRYQEFYLPGLVGQVSLRILTPGLQVSKLRILRRGDAMLVLSNSVFSSPIFIVP